MSLKITDVTITGLEPQLSTRRFIVEGSSFEARDGSILAIVGESGAGKSMLARAIAGILPPSISATGSVALPDGRTYEVGDAAALKGIRGKGVVWLPQDPFTSLSPMHKCGHQILENTNPLRSERRTRIAERLEEVGLPARVAASYPHELSGGMRQRVAIAAALDTEPSVLIADEPTTALDVTTQREILRLLVGITRKRGNVLILITHNLGLAREYADEVIVMREGHVVESGPVGRLLTAPEEEYTRELAAAEPTLADPTAVASISGEPVATVSALTKVFGRRHPHVALDGVDLTIDSGEALAIVGESGSGKTTLARCIAGLEAPTSGSISLDGVGGKRRDPAAVQMVFQNPYAALNPALTVGASLAEVIRVGQAGETIEGLLESVGLPAAFASRYPRELSGGERQRVAIARAVAIRPRILICDEAVSALDVRVQAQILDLLAHLHASLGFAMVFITHDLAVAKRMSTRVIVMKDGEVVEEGATQDVLDSPTTDYTRMLLAAVPGQARS